MLGGATLDFFRYLEPLAPREREVAVRSVGRGRVFRVQRVADRCSRVAVSPFHLDGRSREPLSKRRDFHRDPKRLGYGLLSPSFLLRFRRQTFCFRLGLSASFGRRCVTTGFGFCFGEA